MSATTKHTKGGWNRNIKPARKYPVIFAGRNTHVAQVLSAGLTNEEVEANCNLITAAPDLLNALLELITLADDGAFIDLSDTDSTPISRKIRAAISKAKGGE